MVLITVHSIPALIAFTETQGRMPLITSQRRMLQLQEEYGRTGYALYLGGLAQALTKTIPTEHWMLQCRARDFHQKEVSQPPRRSAGLTPHVRTRPRARDPHARTRCTGRGTVAGTPSRPRSLVLPWTFCLCGGERQPGSVVSGTMRGPLDGSESGKFHRQDPGTL